MDDKSGKPKTPEQMAAELFARIRDQDKTVTANFHRMLSNALAKSAKEEFESYERGLIELFTELSPELGVWARRCIHEARELHVGTQ